MIFARPKNWFSADFTVAARATAAPAAVAATRGVVTVGDALGATGGAGLERGEIPGGGISGAEGRPNLGWYSRRGAPGKLWEYLRRGAPA